METDDTLFWLAGCDGQYTLTAPTLEDAKRKMTVKGLSWDKCGVVRGLGDGMPLGQWMELRD